MQNPPPGYTRVCPYLLYEDASSAVEYLTTAFGFVQRLEQTGAAGRMHRELVLGEDGLVMLGQAGDNFKNPENLKERQRFVTEYFAAAGRSGKPEVQFISELVVE